MAKKASKKSIKKPVRKNGAPRKKAAGRKKAAPKKRKAKKVATRSIWTSPQRSKVYCETENRVIKHGLSEPEAVTYANEHENATGHSCSVISSS